MLENLKSQFNHVLKPIARPFIALGIHPNYVTVAGLLLFAGAAWFVYKGMWFAALAIVITGSLLDGLDGVIARETGKRSVFGAILDSSFDRLTEIFLILGVLGYLLGAPIISFHRHTLSLELRAWGVVFCYTAVTLSLMVSYIKARSEGAGIQCAKGLLQRPERLILLNCGLCFGPRVMVILLAVISIFSAITMVQRFVETYKRATAQRLD